MCDALSGKLEGVFFVLQSSQSSQNRHMNTADYANLADQCQTIIGKIKPNLIYSMETKKGEAFVHFSKPGSINFISIIEIGPKGGLACRFMIYDDREPMWDRVRVFMVHNGGEVGPLKIPSIAAGDRDNSMIVARSAMEALKSRFNDEHLDEAAVLTMCQLGFSEVRGDSIRGLMGGKCSPS